MTASPAALTKEDRLFQLVTQAIEDLRPHLKADGGDCELVSIEDDLVRVRMTGACFGCQFASTTLGHVQERLIAATGRALRVAPVISAPRAPSVMLSR